MIGLISLVMLLPQDLIDRDRGLRRSLSPEVDLSAVAPLRVSVNLDPAPDFACGSFDVRSSFRSLFDRNVKEEFLGQALPALQSQLAGSPLVLACYASPTVCDAIKHYRVSANALLGMELDACRGLEQAVGDVRRSAYARALKECLDRKARQGVPLDLARRACRRDAGLTGLDGRRVEKIDLLEELGISEALGQPFVLGPDGLRAESRATAVVEAYEQKRREILSAWEEATRDSTAPAPAPDRLGPVTPAEVERIALMEPGRRDAVIRSLASATALAELVREVHQVERALESGELTAAPELRGEMERRRTQLRAEIGRLVETFEMERRLQRALSEAQIAAEADVAERVRRNLASRREGERVRAGREWVRPWGCEIRRSKTSSEERSRP